MRGPARPGAPLTLELVLRSGNTVLAVFPLQSGPSSVHLGLLMAGAVAHNPDGGPVIASLAHADPLVSDAIKRWADDMRRRGCKPRSVANFTGRAVGLCAYHGWRTVSEVTLDGAHRWLGEQRAAARWSGTTHDQAVSALKCWGEFMVSVGFVVSNPFGHLEACGEVGAEGSRAATTDEARAIVSAARRWEATDRKVKSHLALWYCFLFLTGLRCAEAEAVRWRDLELDGDAPTLWADPTWSKNRRRMGVPLNDEIAGLLRAHRRAGGGPDAPVFERTPNRATWHRVLNLARVRSEDDRRRTLTQHGCRKWLASELDRLGASPGILATALRHFEGIAQKHYVDRLLGECREYFSRLPKLWPDGTCGVPEPHIPKNPLDSGPRMVESDGVLGSRPTAAEARFDGPQMPIVREGNRALVADLLEAQAEFLGRIARALRAGDCYGHSEI